MVAKPVVSSAEEVLLELELELESPEDEEVDPPVDDELPPVLDSSEVEEPVKTTPVVVLSPPVAVVVGSVFEPDADMPPWVCVPGSDVLGGAVPDAVPVDEPESVPSPGTVSSGQAVKPRAISKAGGSDLVFMVYPRHL